MESDRFVNMRITYHIILAAVFLLISGFVTDAYAQSSKNDKQIEVSMRAIGHEVMLAHGDSTSRVLPIQQDGDQYVIQFETEFVFQASKLIAAVDDVVKRTNLATNYIVEMQQCDTEAIIHSYQVLDTVDLTTIACATRNQPKACYNLLFTILDDEQTTFVAIPENLNSHEELSAATLGIFNPLWAIPILLLIGLGMYYYQKEPVSTTNPYIIEIGDYLFDPRNMTLSLADNNIELTSKESDLLSLLHSSANTTVERDDILRNVWGDKGDYVGRTLDVFISKLRKKLEGDPSVKIANIRGVGYRLVVGD